MLFPCTFHISNCKKTRGVDVREGRAKLRRGSDRREGHHAARLLTYLLIPYLLIVRSLSKDRGIATLTRTLKETPSLRPYAKELTTSEWPGTPSKKHTPQVNRGRQASCQRGTFGTLTCILSPHTAIQFLEGTRKNEDPCGPFVRRGWFEFIHVGHAAVGGSNLAGML